MVIVRVVEGQLLIDRDWYLAHCGTVIAPRLSKEYGFSPDLLVNSTSSIARITAREILSAMFCDSISWRNDDLLMDRFNEDQKAALEPLWDRVRKNPDHTYLPDAMPEAAKIIGMGGRFAANQIHRLLRENSGRRVLVIAEWNCFSFLHAIKLCGADSTTVQPERCRGSYPGLGVTLIIRGGGDDSIAKAAYVPEPLYL